MKRERMTANQKAQARIFFENRILKADNQAFEDLFTEIMEYKEPNAFRSIKPWGNIGDRKNDGYIPSRGIFYQVYAPENIENSYPKLIKKIKDDASGLIEQWSDVKEFYFVVNDKYKGVNADSEQLLTQIKEDNGLDESKFITASSLENILFSLSDDQIIKITGVSFIDNPILTPAILQNSYLKKFSTISLLTTNTPKPIDDIFVNLAIIKEREEKQEKQIPERQIYNNNWEEIHKPKEPIEELVNKSNKSLIYGKAGIGKTTLCKYIAYKWAKGKLYQEFEYLIYIPLREWKSDSGIKGAIRDYYYSLDEKDISIDFDANKTLFLFDGYDELDGDKKKALRDEIDKYALTHYLITTRPYGYQKSDFIVDEYFETIGFIDEDVTDYIDNFFGKGSEKGKGLKNFLQSNISINHIAYIPLMLEMICSLWEQKEFDSDITMTELYGQVIENMLKKYSANKDDKRVYTRKNRKKIQEQLGKLAFEGLTKQSILFDGDFIEDSIDDVEFFEENTIYSGFLKSDAKEKDLLDNCFEFPHLTFQEYFSALYVSKLESQEQSEIIRDWKFYPHMQMFFAFLGGLIEDKEFLIREVESEPRDLMGFYEFLLIMSIISDIKHEELSKQRSQNIDILLNQWLTYILEKGNYNSFLEKLYFISQFIESTVIQKLVNLLDEEIDIVLRMKIARTLVALNQSDNLEHLFFDYIKHEKIDSESKETLEILSSLDRNDINIINILMNFLKDNELTVKEFIDELILLEKKDIEIINILNNLIEEKNIDVYFKIEIANGLASLGRNDNSLVVILSNLLKDKSVSDYAIWEIAEVLRLLGKSDDKVINIFSSLINNKNIDIEYREEITEIFASLTFQRYDILDRNIINLFPDILIKESSIQSFIYAFDNNYINLDMLFQNAFHNTLPLYLKNNKLHTIENGKEISTQREVDEATLNEIKMLLREEGLDD